MNNDNLSCNQKKGVLLKSIIENFMFTLLMCIFFFLPILAESFKNEVSEIIQTRNILAKIQVN